MWWDNMSVDYGLTAKQTAAILDMTDEEWHRLLWLEMWRLIGLEEASRCRSTPNSAAHRGHEIFQDGDVWRYKSDGTTVQQARHHRRARCLPRDAAGSKECLLWPRQPGRCIHRMGRQKLYQRILCSA